MLIDIPTLTTIHTALSFIAMAAGVPVMLGLFGYPITRLWIVLFIVSAIATTVTGFFLPFTAVTPAFITGIIASIVMLVVLAAHYGFRFRGTWRWLYAAGMVASFYLLVFVAIAQAFLKLSFLQPLAPTLSEPPFAIAQSVAFLAFVGLGFFAARKFKPLLAG